ncbi:MAG: hypothetical protein U0Q12_18845 [Vicinamibacterales bacterium]
MLTDTPGFAPADLVGSPEGPPRGSVVSVGVLPLDGVPGCEWISIPSFQNLRRLMSSELTGGSRVVHAVRPSASSHLA